ncbi:MAG: benzoyl-CoA 2,3-epoxidase subunit BoxB [Rhodospirillaceae bacterium]|nr:benzoyl-CoA 2,3-epoxidase subunit BoxB [Rhodospirillaceae bacterium]
MLQKYFGREGRAEADGLLERRSGDEDKPRMLGAFNEATPDWLSFFMFTYFTDRDGKMQLESLAQSGFDPLARTTRFMLTEEAHHMFVGETGVSRVIARTCEAMRCAGIEDPYEINRIRALGVIDLPTIQKKANLHYSLSLDLFGSEISTNAANAYSNSLKGRYREDKIDDDHELLNDTYPVLRPTNGSVELIDEPALTALNMRLRDDYSRETDSGVRRWNRQVSKSDINFTFSLPAVSFNRSIGVFSGISAGPDGKSISSEEFVDRKDEWLPSLDDGAYISSLMQQIIEPGCFARWIAPPRVGIDNKTGDFEYVKLQ